MSSFAASSEDVGASTLIHIDPDMLWRCFAVHNIRSGAVTDPFHMNYYNFLSLLHNCELDEKARHARLNDGQLGVIFRSVAYPDKSSKSQRFAKSMRTRIYEKTFKHAVNSVQDFRRAQTHGHKLTYKSFLHALTKCGMAVYPNEPNHRQCLGMFVYHYVLRDYIRDSDPVVRLPYGVDPEDTIHFLADPEVNQFMSSYKYSIDHMFNYFHSRGHRTAEEATRSIGGVLSAQSKKQWMSYSEYCEFVDTHLGLSRSTPAILSKADIAKIFISVKEGGGRGVKEVRTTCGCEFLFVCVCVCVCARASLSLSLSLSLSVCVCVLFSCDFFLPRSFLLFLTCCLSLLFSLSLFAGSN